ncbi:MAG: cyclic pyranopterin monophosphate synthase MoaC [Candidatus Eisenbacteria bacterium]
MKRISHLDSRGRVRMVDVSTKAVTAREAMARGRVRMRAATLRLLRDQRSPKGDVLTTAHLAGVMAAKRTGDLIPLAHPLLLDGVDIAFTFEARPAAVAIEARVRTSGRTGVEMEALTAVALAGLTLIDMLKAVDRTLELTDVAIWEKRGGRSGEWSRAIAETGATRKRPRGPVRAAGARTNR